MSEFKLVMCGVAGLILIALFSYVALLQRDLREAKQRADMNYAAAQISAGNSEINEVAVKSVSNAINKSNTANAKADKAAVEIAHAEGANTNVPDNIVDLWASGIDGLRADAAALRPGGAKGGGAGGGKGAVSPGSAP